MRKGFSDAQIAANGLSAVHNIGQFIEFMEFGEGEVDDAAWGTALQIAADLTLLCEEHAADRRSGIRFW